MLNRNDIKRMLTDLLRTELARHKKDTLAVFATQEGDLLSQLPADLLQQAFNQAGMIFGYGPRAFTSIEEMTDYAFAAYMQHHQVVFLTSGSTGEPKPCVHTHDMIVEEAYGVAPLFTGVKRIISLVPSSHLYGFTFTVALPHVLHVPVVNLPAIPTQPWHKLLQSGDLVAGFPLFWNYWLRCEHTFPDGIHVLTSTAPCEDRIIEGLLKAGACQFTEIYGASETGAIAHRHGPHHAFELFPFWQLDTERAIPAIKRACNENWISLPDQITLSKGRYLRPIARHDACVQIAGINVYPKRVEQVLARHPAVRACRVRLMRPEEGNRLKAFIVLNEGYTPEFLDVIRAFLAEHLTTHEMPRTFKFGPRLPLTHLGKDSDW